MSTDEASTPWFRDRGNPRYWVLMEDCLMAVVQATLDTECRAWGFANLAHFLSRRDAGPLPDRYCPGCRDELDGLEPGPVCTWCAS